MVYSPDGDGIWRCSRQGCKGEDGKPRKSSPTRWVSICRDGHLHPFDYWKWAHGGKNYEDITCPRNSDIDLIKNKEASYTLEGWDVVCTECGERQNMYEVPRVKETNGPPCKGKGWRPWLGQAEASEKECTHRLVHKQIGSAAVTYSDSSSIMLLPLGVSWSFAKKQGIDSLAVVRKAHRMKEMFEMFPEIRKLTLRSLRNSSYITPDGSVDPRFFKHLEEYLDLHKDGILLPGNLRNTEAKGLRFSEGEEAENYGDEKRFICRPVIGMSIKPPETWKEDSWPVEFVSRADRLTELQYITGLRRLVPDAERIQDIDLRGENKRFGIARYNFGEGIYIQIKPSWLESIAQGRNSKLNKDHAQMLLSDEKLLPSFKEQMPCVENPEGKNLLTILHTFSHLIIKQLCEMSGYSLGSIRERLYLDTDNDSGKVKLAGILLYTSGPSSDGTLGGLVSQASRKRLEKAIKRALIARADCSNDPVCMDHKPMGDEINGAACHTCVFLPETSCELRNYCLDRNWGDR
jgi:hypothetical protein